MSRGGISGSGPRPRSSGTPAKSTGRTPANMATAALGGTAAGNVNGVVVRPSIKYVGRLELLKQRDESFHARASGFRSGRDSRQGRTDDVGHVRLSRGGRRQTLLAETEL